MKTCKTIHTNVSCTTSTILILYNSFSKANLTIQNFLPDQAFRYDIAQLTLKYDNSYILLGQYYGPDIGLYVIQIKKNQFFVTLTPTK